MSGLQSLSNLGLRNSSEPVVSDMALAKFVNALANIEQMVAPYVLKDLEKKEVTDRKTILINELMMQIKSAFSTISLQDEQIVTNIVEKKVDEYISREVNPEMPVFDIATRSRIEMANVIA